MLRNLSEKLRAKFPATTRGYSVVKIVHLDDVFSEFFELEASPVEVQSLQQTDEKMIIRKGVKRLKLKKKKQKQKQNKTKTKQSKTKQNKKQKTKQNKKQNQKPKDEGHSRPKTILIFAHAGAKNSYVKQPDSGKKGMLSCCKCLFV